MNDLVNEARLALWTAYCDMKTDLKESADRIEKLEAALLAVKLTSVDFVAVTIAVEALEEKNV